MAQRTVVQLTDDLDGKPIPDGKGETIRFSLDRTDYEIDLTDKNAKALRDAFATYVSAARRSTPAAAAAAAAGPAAGSGPERPGTTTRRQSASGRSPKASRSASAAGSRLTSSPSSKQPTLDRLRGASRYGQPRRSGGTLGPGGWTAPRQGNSGSGWSVRARAAAWSSMSALSTSHCTARRSARAARKACHAGSSRG